MLSVEVVIVVVVVSGTELLEVSGGPVLAICMSSSSQGTGSQVFHVDGGASHVDGLEPHGGELED